MFTAIRLYGVHSLFLGVVAATIALSASRPELMVTAVITVALKAILIPGYLMRIIDRIGIHREIEPFLNVPTSLYGVPRTDRGRVPGQYRLPAGRSAVKAITSSASLFPMLLIGMFLMVTRKKAITQILALLTVENAVFLIAVGVTPGMPLVVELGIAFDVIVAVLLLGILVQRIVDRFESMDVGRLSKLKG